VPTTIMSAAMAIPSCGPLPWASLASLLGIVCRHRATSWHQCGMFRRLHTSAAPAAAHLADIDDATDSEPRRGLCSVRHRSPPFLPPRAPCLFLLTLKSAGLCCARYCSASVMVQLAGFALVLLSLRHPGLALTTLTMTRHRHGHRRRPPQPPSRPLAAPCPLPLPR
jgi:hypothetical protein